MECKQWPAAKPAGNTRFNKVPPWLRGLHQARAEGQIPSNRWVLLSLGIELAARVPWIAVPGDYQPDQADDFSALTGLDCEIAIDDTARYGCVCTIANRLLAFNPRRLLVQTFGHHPALIILKGVAHGD
ncbi:hypothetical protein [Cupriavidus plantarum]|uniref:hypothetical protein n=1 Tax=Cupriavidus plantarum TaxID=942865 RepID=UPI000F21913A|nr:hypothetical protein [Cupriavidus plantarum]RLK36108.1 hypothetical protein C7417_3883 [Cupriavidus plantarum]